MTAQISRPEGSTSVVCCGSFLHTIIAKPESPSIPRSRLARLYFKQSSAFGLSVSNLPLVLRQKDSQGRF